jgi:hypothetical protein
MEGVYIYNNVQVNMASDNGGAWAKSFFLVGEGGGGAWANGLNISYFRQELSNMKGYWAKISWAGGGAPLNST